MSKKIIHTTLHPDGREDIDLYPTTSVSDIVDYEGNGLNSVVSIDQVSVSGLVHTYRITYSDGSTQDFKVSDGKQGEQGIQGKQGIQGEQGVQGEQGLRGVSITGIEEVSDEVVGGQTLTTLRIHYSDDTTEEVVVYAQNGESVTMHRITITPSTATQGTFNDEDFNKLLNENILCYISLNAENYFLNDDEHEDNVLGYSHVGFYDSKYYIKTITVNMSTKRWVQDSIEVGDETKEIPLTPSSSIPDRGHISPETKNELLNYLYKGIVSVERTDESRPNETYVEFYRLFKILYNKDGSPSNLFYSSIDAGEEFSQGRLKRTINTNILVSIATSTWITYYNNFTALYKYPITVDLVVPIPNVGSQGTTVNIVMFSNNSYDIDDVEVFYDYFVLDQNMLSGYVINPPFSDSSGKIITLNGISNILAITKEGVTGAERYYITMIVNGEIVKYEIDTQSGIIDYDYIPY